MIIWFNGYFLASDKPTGNLLTSLPMSAYSIFTLKQYSTTLSKIQELEALKAQRQAQNLLDVSNLISVMREVGTHFMHYQRRISQYLTSFVFGSGYNIDGFNMSTMNTDAFLSSLKVIALFMSLPLTAKEWPWHDPERREP
jgi:hypothetical protein